MAGDPVTAATEAIKAWQDRCDDDDVGYFRLAKCAVLFAEALPTMTDENARLQRDLDAMREVLREAAEWHELEADRLKANRRLGIKNYRAGFWIEKHIERAAIIRARAAQEHKP